MARSWLWQNHSILPSLLLLLNPFNGEHDLFLHRLGICRIQFEAQRFLLTSLARLFNTPFDQFVPKKILI